MLIKIFLPEEDLAPELNKADFSLRYPVAESVDREVEITGGLNDG
jgi:hypothetical protein